MPTDFIAGLLLGVRIGAILMGCLCASLKAIWPTASAKQGATKSAER